MSDEKTPTDSSFRSGMKSSNEKLNDSPISKWENGFQEPEIHGMILIARAGYDARKEIDKKADDIEKYLVKNKLTTLIFIEKGDGIKNANGDDIEHFGYVDGISQPKFFKSELPTEHDQWNPMMPLDLVLVPDKLGKSENSFGSYFVFRKLEQNVKAFKEREEELAVELFDEENEIAGAMLVGRFENGMPITLSDEDTQIGGVHVPGRKVGKINNFNYSEDTDGAKCPFHSHIRKTNPRGESPFEAFPNEKHHMMARRGIIYGERKVHPNEANIEEMPTKDVGLLFMSFQADIGNQFEFIQSTWANNDRFVKGLRNEDRFITGVDGVIGQIAEHLPFPDGVHRYAQIYSDKNSIVGADGFGGFVMLKGGEYFFAPCLSALKNL